MKIIYNNLIPFRGYSAMMFFGVIFARKKYKPLQFNIINHEEIHRAQVRDFAGGYFSYYVSYLFWCIRKGYKNNPFEREAYANEFNINYLKNRKEEAWKDYIS